VENRFFLDVTLVLNSSAKVSKFGPLYLLLSVYHYGIRT
jgi:hypothetical protein